MLCNQIWSFHLIISISYSHGLSCSMLMHKTMCHHIMLIRCICHVIVRWDSKRALLKLKEWTPFHYFSFGLVPFEFTLVLIWGIRKQVQATLDCILFFAITNYRQIVQDPIWVGQVVGNFPEVWNASRGCCNGSKALPMLVASDPISLVRRFGPVQLFDDFLL